MTKTLKLIIHQYGHVFSIQSPMLHSPILGGQDSLIDKIRLFFEKDLQKRPELLIAVILGPVAVILLVVLVCVGCCCLRSSRKKNKKFNLA